MHQIMDLKETLMLVRDPRSFLGRCWRSRMKFTLQTVRRSQTQAGTRDPRRYIRKHWSLFAAYYVVT